MWTSRIILLRNEKIYSSYLRVCQAIQNETIGSLTCRGELEVNPYVILTLKLTIVSQIRSRIKVWDVIQQTDSRVTAKLTFDDGTPVLIRFDYQKQDDVITLDQIKF